MKLKYKIMLAILAIFIGIGLMTFQSYALWVATFNGGENIVEVGCFSVAFEELSSTISLNNTYPMSDQKGLSGTPYSFKVTNTCSNDVRYQVILNTLTTNGIPSEKMKYAFYNMDKSSKGDLVSTLPVNSDRTNINLANLKESFILDMGMLSQNESVTYHLNIWIDSSAGNEVMNQQFEASINVVNFATNINRVTDYITSLASSENDLAYDNTADHNLRYIGANPNNYVSFNNELWRIVGVMNNVIDGNGNRASRLKIIRDVSIGAYSWDTSELALNQGYGINEWSQADLNVLLNDYYYNARSDVNCNTGRGNATTPCDFSKAGLTDNKSKKLIDTVLWNTGAQGSIDYTNEDYGLVSHFYEYERSLNIGKICSTNADCNDTVPRTSTWTGKIGLMYPSDYGFATSGGSTMIRNACLSTALSNWKNTPECSKNDWLFNVTFFWTLMPFSDSNISYGVFRLGESSVISYGHAYLSREVRPTLFLKPEVALFSGEGTRENPFQLSLS